MITENKIHNIIRESIQKILLEGYLDDVYLSDNFKRWFNGSKIVDENGNPLLLGHGTRSFHSLYKSKKFKTPFIHLASIDDASYFAGGNKRMFRFKNTINKLSDEDVVNFYNKYFKYGSDYDIYLLNDKVIQNILNEYEKEKNRLLYDTEYRGWFSEDKIAYELNLLDFCKNVFLKYCNKNNKHLCCVPMNSKGIPRLTPGGFGNRMGNEEINRWIKQTYPTLKQLRNDIINDMFTKDNYEGIGGTYSLCARVLNPFTINCHGNSWASIYVRPDGCDAYDALFDKYCELGLNKNGYGKGSWFALDNESIAYLAKQLGYDGVIFKNIREGGSENVRMNTTYIVFSTKQLKCPFENSGEFGDTENLFR